MRYVELFEERAVIDGEMVTILRNPVPAMLMFYIGGTRSSIVRGIIHENDVIYWDATKCSHDEIQEYLGLPQNGDGFDVAEVDHDDFRVSCRPEFKAMVLAHPNVRRSLNDPSIHFINEDGSAETLHQ